MKIKRIISSLLLFTVLLCLCGCEKEFEPARVKCILDEEAEEVTFEHLDFDKNRLTVTAVISENEQIVFRFERQMEYQGFADNPGWLHLYKMGLELKSKSKYDIKNIKPYTKRQWDMLTSESFITEVKELKHRSEAQTAVYALTDFGIEVMRSAFSDNVFMIKYDVYENDVKTGSFQSECSYE